MKPARSRRVLALGLAALLAAALACTLSGETPTPTPDTGTSVAATLTALAPAGPSETATPGTGTVTGQVCYPSEPPIPPLTLYFAESGTSNVTSVAHTDGTGVYSVELPPGTYTAYAWRFEYGVGGSYSQAVPCGLLVSCTDHSLIQFQVNAGQTTSGVDICDWYYEDVPTPPGGFPPTATQPAAPATNTPPPGGVSLACDGTYQKLNIIDQGIAGKTVSVDNWDGSQWVNVWNVSSGDPNLKQITDQAGYYDFGSCEKLVIVPMQHSNPQLWFELGIYAWNGAGMSQVYFNEGYYGEWSKNGDVIQFEEASKLGTVNNGPLGPCEWTILQHTWDGSAFVQSGSAVNPVPNCVVTVP